MPFSEEIRCFPGTPNLEIVQAGFRLVLQGLGVDLESPHLQDTPRRAAKAWYDEICVGLTGAEPELRTFPSSGPSQMIVLRDIPVKSVCAHHLLPFIGTACIGYIPGKGEVLGVSKLSRAVNYWARRPQVQEELTTQVADFLFEKVRFYAKDVLLDDRGDEPGGVGVFITCNHLCMELRGVQHPGAMTTSALRGVFEKPDVKAEFLALANGGMR